MKDNWLEIYDILSYCINNGVTESTYQREIENCFKILGWRKANNTLQSQVTIPIGRNNFIRPDLLLQKENENGNIGVIVVEKIGGKMKELATIGVAYSEDEVENLVNEAKEYHRYRTMRATVQTGEAGTSAMQIVP